MDAITHNFDTQWQRFFPISFFSAHDRYEQRSIFRQKGFHAHQILLVLEGTGKVTCMGETRPLSRGCAFFIAKDCPVEYLDTGGLITAFFTFTGSCVAPMLERYGCDDFLYYASFPTEGYADDIRTLIQSFHRDGASGEISANVFSLVTRFFEHGKKSPSVCEEVWAYMRKNFSKKLSLEELAEVGHCSVSKLCHDFKAQYGHAVIRYLVDFRLKRARDLLMTNADRSVKDVAMSCGFEDVGYFCRAYKQSFGVTPSEDKNKL